MGSIENGEVVYFIDTRWSQGVGWNDYIKIGVINGIDREEQRAIVEFLELRDLRCINGIPFDEFESETEWKKLPKGWSYNTRLFDVSYDEFPERFKKLLISDKDNVQKAYEKGYLVKKRMRPIVEAEIDRHLGYRIVKKYPAWQTTYCDDKRTFVYLPFNDIFFDYSTALKRKKELENERKKKASQSELELSWEDINIVLKFFEPELRERYRNRIKQMSDTEIEDMEVRKRGGKLEYRFWLYHGQTEWKELEL